MRVVHVVCELCACCVFVVCIACDVICGVVCDISDVGFVVLCVVWCRVEFSIRSRVQC